jgi:hypothetical protein
MLKITVQEAELFDESTGRFFSVDPIVLDLEHSLFSLSKWESEFTKPFLSSEEKTNEEILGYAYHMIVTPGISRDVLFSIGEDNMKLINAYLERKHTATTFGDMPKQKGRGEVITSELIYYWLVAFQIPFEVEHWNLDRLFALIRICNMKNNPPKKMSKNEIARRNRDLNEQRKAQLGTKG